MRKSCQDCGLVKPSQRLTKMCEEIVQLLKDATEIEKEFYLTSLDGNHYLIMEREAVQQFEFLKQKLCGLGLQVQNKESKETYDLVEQSKYYDKQACDVESQSDKCIAMSTIIRSGNNPVYMELIDHDDRHKSIFFVSVYTRKN